MRIVLTHPFCWPYVRRGSERALDNVARYLVGRGHEVTTISSHPTRGGIEVTASGRRLLSRPYWTPLLGRLHIQETHTFFFPALLRLLSLEPDVVHSFFFTDALAASCARRASRTRRYRTVFQMNGIALPGISCRRFPPEAWMWRKALAGVDERITCSRFVGELLRRYYGSDYRVICPPVEMDDFPLGPGPRNGPPTILAVGDFTIPRKGARVLVQAFRMLKARVPDAVLRLSGRLPETLQRELLRDVPEPIRPSIHVLGLGQPGDVPGLYREASVMCLPAMWEPSGNVMLEAWASGTPVVATNHGGLPEFMAQGLGVLFDPKTDDQETTNAAGLAEALFEGLDLSGQPGIRERCRAHAEQYSTKAIGPLLESLYAGA